MAHKPSDALFARDSHFECFLNGLPENSRLSSDWIYLRQAPIQRLDLFRCLFGLFSRQPSCNFGHWKSFKSSKNGPSFFSEGVQFIGFNDVLPTNESQSHEILNHLNSGWINQVTPLIGHQIESNDQASAFAFLANFFSIRWPQTMGRKFRLEIQNFENCSSRLDYDVVV